MSMIKIHENCVFRRLRPPIPTQSDQYQELGRAGMPSGCQWSACAITSLDSMPKSGRQDKELAEEDRAVCEHAAVMLALSHAATELVFCLLGWDERRLLLSAQRRATLFLERHVSP